MAFQRGRPALEKRVREICKSASRGTVEVDDCVEDVMELIDAVGENASISDPTRYGLPAQYAAADTPTSSCLALCCFPCRKVCGCCGWSVTYSVGFACCCAALVMGVRFFYPFLAYILKTIYWLWDYM